MKKEVFCIDCKYYCDLVEKAIKNNAPIIPFCSDFCDHPKAKYTSVVKTPIKIITSDLTKSPRDLNKNNNCKWFENK